MVVNKLTEATDTRQADDKIMAICIEKRDALDWTLKLCYGRPCLFVILYLSFLALYVQFARS